VRLFRKTIVLLLVIGLMAGLVGCKGGSGETGEGGEVKGNIHFGYVNWDEGIAMTHLLQAIIEDKLGYTVETTQADVGPVFQGVAKGDFDAFVDTWLPVTHEAYLEQFGDQFELYEEPVYKGARIGLVVPAYVEIDSIEELNSVKDRFNGQIIGIDAGAGIMRTTDTAIQEYGLELELVKSSGPAMTASLAGAIDDNEWVVVTGWSPHWKFARWDLKYLEDPKGVYGAEENIYAIARKGLEEDAPEVAALLKKFKMDDIQLGTLEDYINEGMAPIDAGRKWMEENPDVVNSWLQ
jgi:glycine betaine/proline transport system substrate-binding protein